MREGDKADSSSGSLARYALLSTATVAFLGSGLGVLAILRGFISGVESAIVLCGGVFVAGLLFTLLFCRRVAIQTVATLSTAYYAIYLCAGMIVALRGTGDHVSLFIYLVWFFPLLIFNKMVNSPAIGRFLARIIVVAPFVILCGLFIFRNYGQFATASLYLASATYLSYGCFALGLNAVTRYREAFVAEQERAESARIESEVLGSISDCFISLDAELRLVYLNDAACSEFGVRRSAALKRRIQNAVPGFFSSPMLDGIRAAYGQVCASMFEAQDGKQSQWYEMRCFPRSGRLSIYFRNITESVLSRHKLEAAHTRLREQSKLLDKAQDAIFVQDMDSRCLYWNKGAERLFGWTTEEAVGQHIEEIFKQNEAEIKGAFSSVVLQGELVCEIPKRHKDGRLIIVESRSTLLFGDDGRPVSILAINTDITDRKAADERIHNLAFYDRLTGLPNRALLRERLDAMLSGAQHQQQIGALLLIDLDDFKTLNDTAGHDLGDLLLQEVASRLTACMRKSDSVARIGGDEFVVLLEGLSADAEVASAESRVVGDKILRACREKYLLGNYEYDGTASIGATLFRGRQDAVDDLLKRVDLAMYRAKAQGRNTLCFFNPSMGKAAASRAALLADLKRALQNRDFELHYQPQVDSDGRIIGAEALLRWRHDQRGMVPPNEFIPLAESAGLIVDLGLWVLETACAQLARWARQPELDRLNLAVNVSTRQFLDARFVHFVEKALRDSGANPHRLKLEVTESVMMEKANETIAKMTALRAHGVGFSMDDFGTGYSSLSQLKRLPLDQIKIDQSFVRDVLNGVKDASIVRTIITLGRSLNLLVIAEGVETEAQREFLEVLGCYAYQGYLFSPALAPAKFEAFVEIIRSQAEKETA